MARIWTVRFGLSSVLHLSSTVKFPISDWLKFTARWGVQVKPFALS
jgi:hypothetical protein